PLPPPLLYVLTTSFPLFRALPLRYIFLPSFPLPFSFFFNHTAPPEISTLPLHDALPISPCLPPASRSRRRRGPPPLPPAPWRARSEEHTSELQSLTNLVCRLLLEKKKKKTEKDVEAKAQSRGELVIHHAYYGEISMPRAF